MPRSAYIYLWVSETGAILSVHTVRAEALDRRVVGFLAQLVEPPSSATLIRLRDGICDGEPCPQLAKIRDGILTLTGGAKVVAI